MVSVQASRIIRWVLILLLPLTLIFIAREVINPFIISLIIAYLLQPLINRLSKLKIPRSISSFVIILMFFSLAIGFVVFLVPVLYSQFSAILNVLPTYINSLKEEVYTTVLRHDVNLGSPQILLERYSNQTMNVISGFIRNIWSSTFFIVDMMSIIFITPVITFYMLRDWPLFVKAIDKSIPRRQHSVVIEQLRKIDAVLSAYIRGQTQVCIFLALFYSSCLSLTGLQHSLLIGLFTGVFAFVPYLGFAIGFSIGMIFAFFQFDSLWMQGAVLGVFVAGQILESSVITPNIIGDNIKLHPIWLIFAIFTGGSIYGFTGVLFAIPVAAIVGVVSRFLLDHYFTSDLYATIEPVRKDGS